MLLVKNNNVYSSTKIANKPATTPIKPGGFIRPQLSHNQQFFLPGKYSLIANWSAKIPREVYHIFKSFFCNIPANLLSPLKLKWGKTSRGVRQSAGECVSCRNTNWLFCSIRMRFGKIIFDRHIRSTMSFPCQLVDFQFIRLFNWETQSFAERRRF